MKCGRNVNRVTMLAISLVLTACGMARAQLYLEHKWDPNDETPTDPHRFAILIGCERYQKFPELRFCANDCLQLAKTLVERGGFQNYNVEQIVDMPDDPQRGPFRATVMREIPQMLGRLTADDQVIVFFSGHGYRDREGKLYLATLDCDPQNPAETGIPVEWLREQLATCPAKLKFLLLDACHAGSDKGEEFKGVVSKDLGEPFRDIAGVMTLASSTAEETSQLWETKEQSLFSYWLNQGLKGNADENGDSEVDLDELNKYVHRNVTRVAKDKFNRSQTPVRIMRGTPGSPVLLKLNPLSLKQLMSDIAEELSSALEDAGVKKVAVLEFTAETSLGEVLGANFGLLGKQCASDLERLLMQRAHNTYSVIDQRRLQTVLKSQHFKIQDLGSDKAMEDLSKQLDGLPSIAQGTLRSRLGRAITLQCKLLDTATGAVAASAGGVAMLSESEWAMLGHSAVLADEDLPAPSPDNPQQGPKADLIVYEFDKKAKGRNPLADPRFEFPVRIMIGGRERKGVFRGNDYLVPVKKGEVYEIDVQNRSGRPMIMRCLVDGLNTLPERETDTKGVRTYAVAKRVNLEDARYWVMDPKVSTRFAIRGFVTDTGPQGRLRKFTIVDGEESVAARQEFTEQLGMITVAFYDVLPLPRAASSMLAGAAPGTGFGEEQREDLSVNEEYQIGQLRAVVNIRYASPEAIQEASNDQKPQPAPSPST